MKRGKKQRITTVILCFLLLLIGAAIAFLGMRLKDRSGSPAAMSGGSTVSQASELQEDQLSQSISQAEPTATPEPTDTPTPEPTPGVQQITAEGLNSSHALLVERDNMDVLMDQGGDERIYPASMTKIMTAILAIENLQNLDETIRIPEEIFAALSEQGASVAGFYPYEQVTVRSLLYGVLLPSGADACLTLAQKVGGSESGFVEMMNQKASELGLSGTHFVNCTGLHDESHYSTCRDLAALMDYCLKSDTFRTVISTATYTTEALHGHASGITMYDSMFRKFTDYNLSVTLENGAVIEGGKTGFTDEAGQCLVSFAKHGEKEYILVTAGAMAASASESASVRDAITVYGKLS